MRRTFLVPETIETERLTLRLPGADDLDAFTAMLADPEVDRFIGGAELAKPETAYRALGWLIGHWHLRGYGPWIVTERSSGALVGRVGGFYPPEWPALEIAWTLARLARKLGCTAAETTVLEETRSIVFEHPLQR